MERTALTPRCRRCAGTLVGLGGTVAALTSATMWHRSIGPLVVALALSASGCEVLQVLDAVAKIPGGGSASAKPAGNGATPADRLVSSRKVKGPPGPEARVLAARAYLKSGEVALELVVTDDRTCKVTTVEQYRLGRGPGQAERRHDEMETCDSKPVAAAPVELVFGDGGKLVSGTTDAQGKLTAMVTPQAFKEHAGALSAMVAGQRVTTADEAFVTLAETLRARPAPPANATSAAAAPAGR